MVQVAPVNVPLAGGGAVTAKSINVSLPKLQAAAAAVPAVKAPATGGQSVGGVGIRQMQ
jgi:hypothetical protein